MKYYLYLKKFLLILVFASALGLAACGGDDGDDNGKIEEITINIGGGVELSIVRIPGGTFTMGHSTGEVFVVDPHSVTLDSFYMSKYQVTQEQYEEVMDSNPSYFHGGTGREPSGNEIQGRRSVEQVSWYDAIVFCNRLSIREGLNPVYSMPGYGDSTDPEYWIQENWGNIPTSDDTTWNAVAIVPGATGYRLPTDEQWEYACRAGSTTAYSFGDDAKVGDNDILGKYAWYNGNSMNSVTRDRSTHQVGLKLPNAFGLYDMHGNVHEWCWEWYDWRRNGRVRRGGSFFDIASGLSLESLLSNDPSHRIINIGFRVVRQ